MRLQLHLSPNTQPVPYDHLHNLTGAIHKWLGPNEQHDGQSLYSFGWLRGGESSRGALRFPQGASWTISFHDVQRAKQLLGGLLEEPLVMFGMVVIEVREVAPPRFGDFYQFYTDGSSILARQKRADGSRAYLLWDDPTADEVLTTSLQRKLALAGFDANQQQVRVRFDRDYALARTRKSTIKGVHHRGSECPVIVEGSPEALHFTWLVGMGDLTGSGFGALR
ncbi:CRISPR-associated endoribonuclease Cas6 [Fibrella sp. WM1]|uniref:CRISPR-associated endoribonuclease Cas6 n=1 Tax=Fibrella musci TaxID=3242485 RepID=UPI0035221402